MLIYDKKTKLYEKNEIREVRDNEIAWIKLINPSENEILRVLGGVLKCKPRLISDMLIEDRRVKIIKSEEQFFFKISITNITFQIIKIGVVVGENYVVTIANRDVGFLEDLYAEIVESKILIENSLDLLYHVLYSCTDNYMSLNKIIEDKILNLEQKVLNSPYLDLNKEIFSLKKDMQILRLTFSEELSIINELNNMDINENLEAKNNQFSNIYDNVNRFIDSLDIFRESISSLLEFQISVRSDKMNEVIKTLTIFSTIFLPLTFIVGLYGMNFEYLPELNWKYGYVFAWVIMIIITVSLLFFFKKKKYL
jgi:magnesium transporter